MKVTRRGIDFNPDGEHDEQNILTWADLWCQTWHHYIRRAWLPGLANFFGGHGPAYECTLCHKQWGTLWL